MTLPTIDELKKAARDSLSAYQAAEAQVKAAAVALTRESVRREREIWLHDHHDLTELALELLVAAPKPATIRINSASDDGDCLVVAWYSPETDEELVQRARATLLRSKIRIEAGEAEFQLYQRLKAKYEGVTMTKNSDNDNWVEKVGAPAFAAIKEMVEALELAQPAEDSNEGGWAVLDEAVQAIQEAPLSVEVRSGWYTIDDISSPLEPEEYKILLSTGGPAARIVGGLSNFLEPESASLEVQDWWRPWTKYPCDEEVLLRYARQFYFGEC